MKYIKLILATAIIGCVAGFVIWQVMWMTEVERKLKTVQEPAAVGKNGARDVGSNGQREKAGKVQPAPEQGAGAVQEDVTRTDQTATARQETGKPEESRSPAVVNVTGGGNDAEAVKESGRWYERDIKLGKKVQPVIQEPWKPATGKSDEKVISVTTGNRGGPAEQRNMPQPQTQTIRIPDRAISAPAYPTSTGP